MTDRLRRVTFHGGIILVAAATYLSMTQASFAEIDCSKPPKTSFEEATCISRYQAGLLKKPPIRIKRPPPPWAAQSAKKPRTWAEADRQARAMCDAIGYELGCAGYWRWQQQNPRPADINAPWPPPRRS